MGLSVLKPEWSWMDWDVGQPRYEMQETSNRAQHTRLSEAPAELDSEHDQMSSKDSPLSSPPSQAQTLFQVSGS